MGNWLGSSLHAPLKSAQGSLAHSTPTPGFSFFLPRPLEVFAVCILSVLSISETLLTPSSWFFSRSVLESPGREEEGYAHKWEGMEAEVSGPSPVRGEGKPSIWVAV